MATAMFALSVKKDPESEPEQRAPQEDTPRGSSRLIETQRQTIEEEIEHAASILRQSLIGGEEAFYSEKALDRAVAFLRTHIEWVWRSCGTKAPVPTIGPGPRGSVDLYWKRPSWELLVNIPASADDPGTFYGHDDNKQKAKGSFDPEYFTMSIATWLMM